MSQHRCGKTCWLLALIALVAGAGGGWYWLSGSAETAEPVPEQSLAVPLIPDEPVAAEPVAAELISVKMDELPAVPTSRFQNTSAEATYVGALSCVECHPDEHESYLQTVHSRSLGEIDLAAEPPDGEFVHSPSGRSYRIYRSATELRHRETIPIDGGEELELADYPLRYIVGSGGHARTYLVETEGYLVESPVTWYASRQQWAMSPGYEHNNTGFARPVYSDCLFCHAGRVEAVGGNHSRVAVHAQVIDCERCHGPGSLHVERWNGESESTTDIDLTIVNPKHLARQENEDICAQCHLQTAAEVAVRGRRIGDFKPGRALKDYRIHFALETPDHSMTVVGHGGQMHLSRCYQSSDTLTCTTCHESHGRPNAAERLGFYKAKCLACHSPEACGLAETDRLRQSPQDNCVACHMPSSSTDVPHVAATHHRIGIHDTISTDVVGKTTGSLTPVGDISHLPEAEQDRCLGLAYLRLSLKEDDAEASEIYRQRARDILVDLRRGGLHDPDTDAALATIYQREDPRRVIEFATSALHFEALSPDTRVKALFALSNAYVNLKQTNLAIGPLEKLVQLRRQAGDWFVLGVCRYQAGDLDGALEAAQRAATIRPDRSKFQALLAELYQQLGRGELAAKHEQRARQLAGAQPEVP